MKEVITLFRADRRTIHKQLLLLAILAVIMVLIFLFYDLDMEIPMIVSLRVNRLLGLLVVAVNLSISTALFQGITQNPILTPSVMGYEAIYLVIVTLMLFFRNSLNLPTVSPTIMFVIQLILMIIITVSLYSVLLRRTNTRVYLLLLLGLILGTFLRSIVSMLTAVMDPNEFIIVQDAQMASFSLLDKQSLILSIGVSVISWIWIYYYRNHWNTLFLGRDLAINLGIDYAKAVKFCLIHIAVLVASATALVGPLMFFGLLSTQLTVYYLKTTEVSYFLPACSLMGIILLVGGQGILEHIFNQATMLPVILEIFGGIILLLMIRRGVKQ